MWHRGAARERGARFPKFVTYNYLYFQTVFSRTFAGSNSFRDGFFDNPTEA
jgi:hypothetical protein